MQSIYVLTRCLGALKAGNNVLEFLLWTQTLDTGKRFSARVLLDSGATENFANEAFIRHNDMTTYELEEPIPVRNADGSLNQGGAITHFTNLLY